MEETMSTKIEGDRGGTIPLADVITNLAGHSDNLMGELSLELTTAGLTIDDVICSGHRLGSYYTYLGGRIVPEYTCVIGARTLTIGSGFTEYYDKMGNPRADPSDAMYLSMSLPYYSWS